MVSASTFGGKVSCGIMLLYIFLFPHKSYSQPCSSCGKISNITNPFRLKHDPDHCGNNKYELDCVNNVTILKLYDGYYFVQSINYNNYTIRVVDPNIQPTNCSSLPHFFLYRNNFTDYDNSSILPEFIYKENNSYLYSLNRSSSTFEFDEFDLSRPVIYMKCTSPPSKAVDMYYADTASCLDEHTYVIVGDPHFGILQPQCRVELVTLTSSWLHKLYTYDPYDNIKGNVSYIDIHKALSYGFEISWMKASCPTPCDECFLNDTIGEIQCYVPDCPFDSCGYWSYKVRLLFDYVAGIYVGLRELTGMDKIKNQIYKSYINMYKAGIVTGRYVLPYLATRVILGIILFSALLIYTYRRR